MKKLRGTTDHYCRSLAGTRQHAPKWERRQNFFRFFSKNWAHTRALPTDTLQFRRGAFMILQRGSTKLSRRVVAEQILSDFPIVGPQKPLP